MSDTLTLLSFILTCVLGIPALITWIKKYSTEIIFIQQEIVNLHNKFVRNIEDLKIYYKGNQISELIYIIRGFLLCKGKKDISSRQVEKPLRLLLPEDSRWIDFSLLEASDDLTVQFEPKDNELLIRFDLLKNKDFIYFQGLFEAESLKKLDDVIKFKHRIENVGRVKKVNAKEYGYPIFSIVFFFCLGIVNLFVTLQLNNFFSIRNSEFKAVYYTNGVQDTTFRHESSIIRQVINDYNYFQLMFNIESREYKIDDDLTVKFTLSNLVEQLISIPILVVSVLMFYFLFNFLINYLKYKSFFTLIKKTIDS